MQSYFFAELTSEESLAMKANYAREMAKAVNSAQFKKKRLFAKKQDAKIDDKEKVSRVPCKTGVPKLGYMYPQGYILTFQGVY